MLSEYPEIISQQDEVVSLGQWFPISLVLWTPWFFKSQAYFLTNFDVSVVVFVMWIVLPYPPICPSTKLACTPARDPHKSTVPPNGMSQTAGGYVPRTPWEDYTDPQLGTTAVRHLHPSRASFPQFGNACMHAYLTLLFHWKNPQTLLFLQSRYLFQEFFYLWVAKRTLASSFCFLSVDIINLFSNWENYSKSFYFYVVE